MLSFIVRGGGQVILDCGFGKGTRLRAQGDLKGEAGTRNVEFFCVDGQQAKLAKPAKEIDTVEYLVPGLIFTKFRFRGVM